MKPETRTVDQLFQLDVRYVVPLYQRPYVWREDDQWEPLWEDILVLLRDEALLAGVQSHFLGAIVLEQENQAPGRIPQYVVIDGQQRLTTLQLLLSASEQVLRENGTSDEAGILGELIVNDSKKAKGDERLKVWPTNVNRRAFKAVLDPGAGDEVDDPKNLIQEAHAYFRARARDWVTDETEDGTNAERSERLRIVLSDLLKVVAITLEPGDNAQVIFETLNARGTPLLALDLVKNAVFQEATKHLPAVDALYDEVWKPQLDDDYWRKERRQGRLKRARGELFLTYWLGMKLGSIIPSTELFATFRKHMLHGTPRPEPAGLIRELTLDARTFRSFDAQPTGSAEQLFFERLEALDVTTVMPLALLLFTRQEIGSDERRRALRMIESWLVRRMLLGLTTKNYNREIADLLELVRATPSDAGHVIRAHLAEATADANVWPSDETVLNQLTTQAIYGRLTAARVAMVLRAIEHLRAGNRPDVAVPASKLTIEHVMPQKWRLHWGLGEVTDELEAAERAANRDRHLHLLGNLTLLTGEDNSSLSNAAWEAKQPYLQENSRLYLTGELLAQYPDRFDESVIERRSLKMATEVCMIWPGPDAAWGSQS